MKNPQSLFSDIVPSQSLNTDTPSSSDAVRDVKSLPPPSPPVPDAPKEELERLLEEEVDRLNEWSRSLDSMRRLLGMEYYVPNEKQMRGHKSPARTILYCGGNRAGKCIGKDFKIFDPILGKEIEVGRIESDFHVLAFDGVGLRIAKAERPFKKEKDKIYEVTLSNGGKFTCSMSHVVLTPDGFRTISDVQVGDELFLPQTILGSSRSVPSEDVQSSYQKAEDSQFDYRSLLRLCGEQLRKEEDISRYVSPLQDGVEEPSFSEMSSHRDGSGNIPYNNRLYSNEPLLSNSDDPLQISDQSFDTLSGVSGITSKSVDSNILVVQKSIDESFLPRSIFSENQCPNSADSILPFGTSCFVRIISIAYLRFDYKWDFTVPVYHNYFGNGCIHHNSTFGAIEICWAMTKRYPSWYPERKRFDRPVKAVVSATSFAVVLRVIEPKLTSLLPRGSYTVRRTPGGHPTIFKFQDGSTLDVLTLEMDDSAYESADWDLAWLDEPQSQKKYQAILRGLVDRRGRMMITFTPLTEPWMKDDIADKADGKAIELITVDIRDNMKTVNGSPILSEDAVREFEINIPEDVKETRMHGRFFHLRGAVYQEFSEEHVKEFAYAQEPVICVCDPHDRVPHHVIWAFIDRNDDIFVDYEWDGHVELPDLAGKICEIEKARGYRMKRRIIDPNFGRKPYRPGSNASVMTELSRYGCPFYEGDDDVELGHMIVRDYLHYNRLKPVTAFNKPKLFFSKDRVPKTIRSVRNLQYEEWAGKTAGEKDPKEREKDKENHGADCIRYLCISKPRNRGSEKGQESELSQNPY